MATTTYPSLTIANEATIAGLTTISDGEKWFIGSYRPTTDSYPSQTFFTSVSTQNISIVRGAQGTITAASPTISPTFFEVINPDSVVIFTTRSSVNTTQYISPRVSTIVPDNLLVDPPTIGSFTATFDVGDGQTYNWVIIN